MASIQSLAEKIVKLHLAGQAVTSESYQQAVEELVVDFKDAQQKVGIILAFLEDQQDMSDHAVFIRRIESSLGPWTQALESWRR